MSIPWSPGDKKIARLLFDLAAAKAKSEILNRHEEIQIKSIDSLWDYELEIRRWRKEYCQLFQYTYSSLDILFATCMKRGWLVESNLKGFKEERVERILKLYREVIS